MQGVALKYLFQETLQTKIWVLLCSIDSLLFRKKVSRKKLSKVPDHETDIILKNRSQKRKKSKGKREDFATYIMLKI